MSVGDDHRAPRRLSEMTSPEVADAVAGGAAALFPVGAVEQHGGYLPLGTDTLAAIALAEDVSARTGAVVAPPLWCGFSPHHMWLAGTITLRPETIAAFVVDVCESLAAHGFRRIVIVNGHRLANLPPLQLGAWRAGEALPDAEVVLVDMQHLVEPLCIELGIVPLCHGDECETAHLMHLRRELVHEDRIPRTAPAGGASARRLPVVAVPPPRSRLADRTLEQATMGHPDRATAENGRRLHEEMVARLAEVVRG